MRRGLLYLGTENAIYVSFDDGENWQPLQNNMPHAPVYWIAVQEHFNDLVIATYGRGFWILDDITPLQQLTPQVLARTSHLFPPRPAYRFRQSPAPSTTYDDPTVGENPTYGASINYYLQGAAGGPGDAVYSGRQGTGRADADGPEGGGTQPRLLGSRDRADARGADAHEPDVCAGNPRRRRRHATGPRRRAASILMPPGIYTVKLSAGGRELTQPLTVRKDPNSGGTEADIAAQTRVLVDLRDHLNEAAEMVILIEGIRSQIEGSTASRRTRLSGSRQRK